MLDPQSSNSAMDRAFSWIWRINGLILLVIATLVAGAASIDIYKRMVKPGQKPVATNIADDPTGKEKWVLANAAQIDGSDYSYIRLESKVDTVSANATSLGAPESSISYDYDRRRANSKNVLFVNDKTGDSNWLFDGTSQLIGPIRHLSFDSDVDDSHGQTRKTETKYLVYSVFSVDSNGDDIISLDDNPAMVATDATGANFQEIIRDYERIISTKLLDDGTLSVIHQTDGSIYMLNYSMEDSEVVRQIQIPAVDH